MSEAKPLFYKRASLTNTTFSEIPTHKYVTAQHLILVNDSNNILSFSFDGEAIDGELLPDDDALTLAWKANSRIWLKTDSATPVTNYRIWAWVE